MIFSTEEACQLTAELKQEEVSFSPVTISLVTLQPT